MLDRYMNRSDFFSDFLRFYSLTDYNFSVENQLEVFIEELLEDNTLSVHVYPKILPIIGSLHAERCHLF